MNSQKRVAQKLRDYNMSTDAYVRLVDCMAEIGEVSHDLLRETDFGRTQINDTSRLHNELGDVYFALLALADACHVDLEAALDDVIEKYHNRFSTHGTPGSRR